MVVGGMGIAALRLQCLLDGRPIHRFTNAARASADDWRSWIGSDSDSRVRVVVANTLFGLRYPIADVAMATGTGLRTLSEDSIPSILLASPGIHPTNCSGDLCQHDLLAE